MSWILIAINLIFVGYLVYAYKTVGSLTSISASFYHPQTKKVFKLAMWLSGSLFTFYDGSIETQLAGLALIGVPLFGDFRDSIVQYFHYAFAGAFYMLLAAYISPYMLLAIIVAGLVLKGMKMSLYWIEVLGAVTIFTLLHLV